MYNAWPWNTQHFLLRSSNEPVTLEKLSKWHHKPNRRLDYQGTIFETLVKHGINYNERVMLQGNTKCSLRKRLLIKCETSKCAHLRQQQIRRKNEINVKGNLRILRKYVKNAYKIWTIERIWNQDMAPWSLNIIWEISAYTRKMDVKMSICRFRKYIQRTIWMYAQ